MLTLATQQLWGSPNYRGAHIKKRQPTLQPWDGVLMKVDPPAPIKLMLSRTKASYRFISKINGCCCFKPLGFGVVWLDGNHLSFQWNPSPLTPDWTSLHSLTTPHNSLPLCLSHTIFSIGMSSSHWNLTYPWWAHSVATCPMKLPSLPRLVVISSSSQTLKNFVSTSHIVLIATIDVQRISLLARPSTDQSEGGLLSYLSCDLMTLRLAAKLVPCSLSSSCGLYAPSGRGASYIFVSIPIPHAKHRVVHVIYYIRYEYLVET